MAEAADRRLSGVSKELRAAETLCGPDKGQGGSSASSLLLSFFFFPPEEEEI